MLTLLLAVACLVTGAVSVPLPAPSQHDASLPDYFVIESIPQLTSPADGPPGGGVISEWYAAQLRRQEEEEARLRGIKMHVLHLLNLPCVPRGPPDTISSNIDSKFIKILHNLMQNQTDSDSEDLLKRAQSFYPACESPEEVEDIIGDNQDSMNVYFNLSSFFLPQPENVTIDMAELRLYRTQRTKERRHIFGFNEVEDNIRVSVYAYSSTEPGADVSEQLVDSLLVPRSGQPEVVTFNVSDAVWSTDDLGLLLRVTVDDLFGNRLTVEDFFEPMDCDGAMVNGSPLPRPLVRYFSKHDIQVKPKHLYPVLDLSTAEMADSPPLDGVVPSIEPCPEPQSLLHGQQRLYNAPNGFHDGLRQRNRRQRRRHHRRPHNRRHSGRRASRHRGQH